MACGPPCYQKSKRINNNVFFPPFDFLVPAYITVEVRGKHTPLAAGLADIKD